MCDVPINIIRQQTDKCNLKCKLWYKYGNSSCLLKNNKDQLISTYDGDSDVMFNSVPYTPTEIRFFKPSIHTYDGQHADAELIIVHKGGSGGLLICVPITVSQARSASVGTNIIEDICAHASTSSEVTTLNIHDYNANFLIPKSSYFSYTGPLPFGECNSKLNVQYVVFHHKQGSISISQASLDNLGNLIHDSYISVYEGKSFFNETGTNSNGFAGEGQIYIDCQPTGEDEEIVYQESSLTSTKPMNLDWFYSLLLFICGVIIMYIALAAIKAVFNPFQTENNSSV
jgi:carbonic anhydrase